MKHMSHRKYLWNPSPKQDSKIGEQLIRWKQQFFTILHIITLQSSFRFPEFLTSKSKKEKQKTKKKVCTENRMEQSMRCDAVTWINKNQEQNSWQLKCRISNDTNNEHNNSHKIKSRTKTIGTTMTSTTEPENGDTDKHKWLKAIV